MPLSTWGSAPALGNLVGDKRVKVYLDCGAVNTSWLDRGILQLAGGRYGCFRIGGFAVCCRVVSSI